MHSQPPGLSSSSINSIFLIDHCVYTVSVQCRREKLWIFCIVAVCTDRHLIGIFPISHKVLYTLAAVMSLSNYLKMYSSVWRWWYLNIYSIFVRSYLFHSYVYCRRPKKRKKKKKEMQLRIIWMVSWVFCILLLTLWLYSSLNKTIWLKMCGDRPKDEQEDRRVLITIKRTCSLLNATLTITIFHFLVFISMQSV